MSNELGTPKILLCAMDSRVAAANFPVLRNTNVSYFVNVRAENGRSTSILAGDRNLTNDSAGGRTVLRVDATSHLRWTAELHRFKGNLLYADGHVEELNRPTLRVTSANANTFATLAMPADEPPSSTPAPRAEQSGIPSVPTTPETLSGRTPGRTVSKQKFAQAVVRSGVEWQVHTQHSTPLTHITVTGSPSSVEREEDLAMGAFDYKLMKFLQSAIKWWYLLVLLLVLIFVAHAIWREWDKRRERRGLQQILKDEI